MSELDSVGSKIESIPVSPEKKEAMEKILSPESIIEKKTEIIEKTVTLPVIPAPAPTQVSGKSETLLKVESILEEDLQDIYFSLPPNRQAAFKKKGEDVALKISILLHRAKINIKKIIRLIHNWLKMLPRINKYFLEQESKIKADKIIELKQK